MDAFGAYAAAPTLVVDARAYAHRKLAALRCHRSQIDAQSPFTWLTAEQGERLLGREFFVRSAVGNSAPAFVDAFAAEPVAVESRDTASRAGAAPPL